MIRPPISRVEMPHEVVWQSSREFSRLVKAMS